CGFSSLFKTTPAPGGGGAGWQGNPWTSLAVDVFAGGRVADPNARQLPPAASRVHTPREFRTTATLVFGGRRMVAAARLLLSRHYSHLPAVRNRDEHRHMM